MPPSARHASPASPRQRPFSLKTASRTCGMRQPATKHPHNVRRQEQGVHLLPRTAPPARRAAGGRDAAPPRSWRRSGQPPAATTRSSPLRSCPSLTAWSSGCDVLRVQHASILQVWGSQRARPGTAVLLGVPAIQCAWPATRCGARDRLPSAACRCSLQIPTRYGAVPAQTSRSTPHCWSSRSWPCLPAPHSSRLQRVQAFLQPC
jgi:hypothetical protein